MKLTTSISVGQAQVASRAVLATRTGPDELAAARDAAMAGSPREPIGDFPMAVTGTFGTCPAATPGAHPRLTARAWINRTTRVSGCPRPADVSTSYPIRSAHIESSDRAGPCLLRA